MTRRQHSPTAIALLAATALTLAACGQPGSEPETPATTQPAPVGEASTLTRFSPEVEAVLDPGCLPAPPGVDLADPRIPFSFGWPVIVVDGERFAATAQVAPLVEYEVQGLDGEVRWYSTFNAAELEAEALVGDLPATFRVLSDRIERLSAVAAGNRFVVTVAGDDGWASWTAVVGPNGEIGFDGPCLGPATVTLAEYRTRGPRPLPDDPLAVLAAVLPIGDEHDAFVDWVRPDTTVAWEDREPSRRVLDPEEMPPHVSSRLVGIRFTIEIDPAWMDYAPATLCTRVKGLGWGDCIPLDSTTALPTERMGALVDPGQPLEIWILDKRATLSRPVTQVGTISAESIDAAIAGATLSVTATESGELEATATNER